MEFEENIFQIQIFHFDAMRQLCRFAPRQFCSCIRGERSDQCHPDRARTSRGEGAPLVLTFVHESVEGS